VFNEARPIPGLFILSDSLPSPRGFFTWFASATGSLVLTTVVLRLGCICRRYAAMLTLVAFESSVDHAPKVCSRSEVDMVRLSTISKALVPPSPALRDSAQTSEPTLKRTRSISPGAHRAPPSLRYHQGWNPLCAIGAASRLSAIATVMPMECPRETSSNSLMAICLALLITTSPYWESH
jgi:hypothetical protein